MKNFASLTALLSLVLMGIMAGFFFAFSNTVMPGLDSIDASAAIEGMQGINSVVRNPMFFVTFFLTPVFCMVAAGASLISKDRKSAVLCLSAGIIYGLVSIALTMMHHVPLNDALGLLDVTSLSDEADSVWQAYTLSWTGMNTVRAIGCSVAMLPLVLAFSNLRR